MSVRCVAGGILLLAMGASGRASAQDGGRRRDGFGLGLGSGTIANGLSGKKYLGDNAVQGNLGFWGGGGPKHRYRYVGGVAVSADFLFEMASLAHSPYFTLDWSFGLGAGLGARDRDAPLGLAAAAVAGLEFNFTRVPLDVVIEYRPMVAILPDPGIELVDFTAHLRFYF